MDKLSCIALFYCTLTKKRKEELAWPLKLSNHVKKNIETFNDKVGSNNLSHIMNYFKNHPLLFLLKWETRDI